jgi:hypothetical protein
MQSCTIHPHFARVLSVKTLALASAVWRVSLLISSQTTDEARLDKNLSAYAEYMKTLLPHSKVAPPSRRIELNT